MMVCQIRACFTFRRGWTEHLNCFWIPGTFTRSGFTAWELRRNTSAVRERLSDLYLAGRGLNGKDFRIEWRKFEAHDPIGRNAAAGHLRRGKLPLACGLQGQASKILAGAG